MSDVSSAQTGADLANASRPSPMAPSNSPMDQLGGAAAKYEGRMDALAADEQKEFAAGQQATAPYRAKLLEMLSSPSAAHAHLEKVREEPKPEDYQKYSMEWASAMALVGAIAGRWTRQGGTAALDAFTGAVKGWQEGNLQAYNNAAKQWEQATKKTLENNQAEIEKYKEIMADKKANIDQMMAAMNLVATEHQNKIMFDATLANNYTMAFNAVDKMAAIQSKLQGSTDKLLGFQASNKDAVKNAVDLYNTRPDLFTGQQYLALKGAADTFGFSLKQPDQQTPFKGGGQGFEAPQTLEADAERYRQTGTLPPNMGRGQQGQALASSIRQRASELEVQVGGDPRDWPTRWQQYRAQGQGYGREQGAIGQRAGAIAISVDEADRTIPVVRDLAKQAAGKGYATWNGLENRWETESGDRLFQQYVTQLNSLVNIYGRVISGGGKGTVSDLEHARQLANPNMPLSGVEGSLDAMQTEINIAQTAPERVRQQIREQQADKIGQPQSSPSIIPPYRKPQGNDASDDGWGDLQVH